MTPKQRAARSLAEHLLSGQDEIGNQVVERLCRAARPTNRRRPPVAVMEEVGRRLAALIEPHLVDAAVVDLASLSPTARALVERERARGKRGVCMTAAADDLLAMADEVGQWLYSELRRQPAPGVN